MPTPASTPTLAARRRAPRTLRAGVAGLFCALCLACGVTRVPQDRGPGPAALPNLRRASEALQERILREQQHVDAFNRQLAALQGQEERLAALLRDAEADFQRLQDDYDFATTDVDIARDELTALQADQAELEAERANLDEALAASQARQLEAETELARVAAAAGLAAGRAEELAQERGAWRERLEVYRARWSVPSSEWQDLLAELGLLEASELEARAAAEAAATAETAPGETEPAPAQAENAEGSGEAAGDPASSAPGEDGEDPTAEPAAESESEGETPAQAPDDESSTGS